MSGPAGSTDELMLPDVLRARGCVRLGLLGEGGMGRVLLLSDPSLGRTMAMKVALGAADGFAWQRLRREASITAELAGPGVVAVFELGTFPDGRPWLTTSRAPGVALSSIMQGEMGRDERLRRVADVERVAACLARVHGRGVVHRDLKAANILVDEAGGVTVLDWGLARRLDGAETPTDQGVAETRAGARLGTPGCMSPEQAAGVAVDARADVWALGILLWELLAGQTAYPGARAPDVVGQVLSGPPSMEPVAWAGPALTGVISRALAPIAGRFEDAGAMRLALREACVPAGQPPPLARPSWGGPVLLGVVAGLMGLVVWMVSPARIPPPVAASPLSITGWSSALTLAAMDLAREGRRHRSELLAADALDAGADPAVRGLLLARSPRPELQLDAARPPCALGALLSPDGSLLVCAAVGQTIGFDVGEDAIVERWRQDVQAHQLQFSGPDVVGQVPDRESLVVLSGAHGGALGRSDLFRSGRLLLSLRPGERARLVDGDVQRQAVDAAGRGAFDARQRPCFADWATILPDGSELLACRGGLVQLDVDTLTERARWPFPADDDRATRVAVSGDGRWLAVSLQGGALGTVEVGGAAAWLDRPEPAVSSLAISPSGWYIAVSNSIENRVWVREQPALTVSIPGRADTVAFDEHDRLLVMGTDRIQRWRVPDVAELGWAAGGPVDELDWGGAGLVARRGDGAVVRLPDGLALADSGVHVVATDPRHDRVALGFSDGRVQVVGQPPWVLGVPCVGLEWLNADTLVCAPAGPGPLLIDVNTGAVEAGLGVPGSRWLEASGAGAGAVTLLDGSGSIWTLTDGAAGLSRVGAEPWANTLAQAPTGDEVALGGAIGVGVVDLRDGQVTQRLSTSAPVGGVLYSADGRWLAVTTDQGDLYLYRDHILAAHTIVAGAHRLQLAFSPDGSELALGGVAGVVERVRLADLDRPLGDALRDARAAWGVR